MIVLLTTQSKVLKIEKTLDHATYIMAQSKVSQTGDRPGVAQPRPDDLSIPIDIRNSYSPSIQLAYEQKGPKGSLQTSPFIQSCTDE